ncbi:MAG: YihY family inner membrane protein [Candidatus Cloacimonetes bacterium]|nr:YihY family inner membrane protein [Candidatus Cloacimonadota bacterium]
MTNSNDLPKPIRFTLYILTRFYTDGCFKAAGSLSYTSLLAITPVLAIAFAILSAFPAFDGMENKIKELIFLAFVPDAGKSIESYLTKFISNANHSTIFGITSLSVTSVMLLMTIQSSFDAIWKSTGKRTFINNVLTFWSSLTLGPLLLGSSLSLSSFLFTQAKILQVPMLQQFNALFVIALPFLLELFAFFLLYIIVPNTHVRWRYSMIGAFFATILFEGFKAAFGYYVSNFPFYQELYGALATIPIILIWLYLSWASALIGAEIAANLSQYDLLDNPDAQSNTKSRAAQKLIYSLKILNFIYLSTKNEKKVKIKQILKSTNAPQSLTIRLLSHLTAKNYLVKSENSEYILYKDIAKTNLYDLLKDLKLIINPDDVASEADELTKKLKHQLQVLNNNTKDITSVNLITLFNETLD